MRPALEDCVLLVSGLVLLLALCIYAHGVTAAPASTERGTAGRDASDARTGE